MKKLFLGLKIDSSHVSLAFATSLNESLTQKFHLRILEKDDSSWDLEPAIIDRIREEIIKVEKACSAKVFKIYFCFPPDRVRKIKAYYKKILHPRHSLPLSASAIKSALEEAKILNLDWEDYCLEIFPVEFKLDGKVFRNPPLGIYVRKLEMDILFYVCRRDDLLYLDKVFYQLGKPYQELVLSNLAEVAFFREDSLGKGNFSLLNIGKNKLEFSYFRNFILEDCFSLPRGGRFIDEELSNSLGIPEKLAEEIKLSYGSLALSDLKDENTITIKRLNTYEEIKKSTLNSIILSSYEKILVELKEILQKKDLLRKIDFLVVIGGASKIKDFDRVLGEKLSLPLNKPSYYLPDLEDKEDRFLAPLGVLRFSFSKFNLRNKYKEKEGLFSKLKKFLGEYF